MVTPNLTFFIEVSLFLLFLWGTARFILRPVLQGLDERAESIDRAREQTEENTNKAETLEADYLKKLSEIRGQADEIYHVARRDTINGHIQAVAEQINLETAAADLPTIAAAFTLTDLTGGASWLGLACRATAANLLSLDLVLVVKYLAPVALAVPTAVLSFTTEFTALAKRLPVAWILCCRGRSIWVAVKP